MREMVLDQCLGTGAEYTREALQEAVNKALVQRDMLPVTSKVMVSPAIRPSPLMVTV